MANQTALVTGASRGIGRELAMLHARRGGDVILTARDEADLRDLAISLEKQHGVKATVIACDLAKPDGAKTLWDTVLAQGHTVDMLINNAGFGGRGLFHEQDLERNLTMIDLNVKSLVTLTHFVLQDMVARKSGRILNVGSTAGMIPGPLQATYHATKAFVNSFSQALDEELDGTNVTVTLLAPGAVDTDFMDVAGMRDAKGVQSGMANAADVARIGYDAMMRGKLVAINDPKLSFLLGWVTPLMPRRTVAFMAKRFTQSPEQG